jgi:23S rRNA pseudouridine1911/1915/1917 synthase
MPIAENELPPIIYQDQDLLVIDKPAGLIINTATSHSQISLQERLRKYLKIPHYQGLPLTQTSSPQDIFHDRGGMVHRLDKNTSGIVVWAKNPSALINLLHQFQTHQVTKTYLCLVHGIFSATQKEGRINLPLARKRTNRHLIAVDPTGREAITFYQVTKEFHHFDSSSLPPTKIKFTKIYQGFSFLKVTPKTGRTHQIRAHFTHLHHALVGDISYLSKTKTKLDPLWCPRQFLHAHTLTLTHPRTQKPLTFTSPLPPDLHSALTYLTP